jgi:2-(3-amino-3-carboxypropyl)histidine synthase
VVFGEYFLDVDPLPTLEKEFDKLRDYEKIGLITSIQFVKTIPAVKKFLEGRGKRVITHRALQYPGQVLGCRLEAAKAIESQVDCFLCISAGQFYAAGVVLEVDKPVLNLDLERGQIGTLDGFKRRVLRAIAWNRAQLGEAKRVGILVSWKRGQLFANPYEVKQKLERSGKEVFILAMDEITPEKLAGLDLDCVINCGCPRIGRDEILRYRVPLLNATDV